MYKPVIFLEYRPETLVLGLAEPLSHSLWFEGPNKMWGFFCIIVGLNLSLDSQKGV